MELYIINVILSFGLSVWAVQNKKEVLRTWPSKAIVVAGLTALTAIEAAVGASWLPTVGLIGLLAVVILDSDLNKSDVILTSAVAIPRAASAIAPMVARADDAWAETGKFTFPSAWCLLPVALALAAYTIAAIKAADGPAKKAEAAWSVAAIIAIAILVVAIAVFVKEVIV